MSKKIDILTDVAALNKAIDSWGRGLNKAMNEGQKLALSALAHLAKCGDIGPANRLYTAMPKGTKTSSMGAYLLAFGALKANDGEDKKEKPFLYDKTKQTRLEAAYEQHWTEFGKEPDVDQVFDLQKAIAALLRKANKAATVTHGGDKAAVALKELAVAVGLDSADVPGKIAGMVADDAAL